MMTETKNVRTRPSFLAFQLFFLIHLHGSRLHINQHMVERFNEMIPVPCFTWVAALRENMYSASSCHESVVCVNAGQSSRQKRSSHGRFISSCFPFSGSNLVALIIKASASCCRGVKPRGKRAPKNSIFAQVKQHHTEKRRRWRQTSQPQKSPDYRDRQQTALLMHTR